MISPTRISEDDMTSDTLADLCDRAFLKTSIDDDGDLVVQTDGPRVFMLIDEDKKLLKFLAIYGFCEDSSVELRHKLVNRMNDQIIFARFCVPTSRPELLIADYFLSYENGISEYQIMASLRLFAKVVPGAIRSCDDDDIVE